MYNYYLPDLSSGIQNSLNSANSTIQGIQVWTIVATILAIVGSVLIYFLFIKSKNNFKGGLKTLRDYLSGDLIHIEALAKMFYYLQLITSSESALAALMLEAIFYNSSYNYYLGRSSFVLASRLLCYLFVSGKTPRKNNPCSLFINPKTQNPHPGGDF